MHSWPTLLDKLYIFPQPIECHFATLCAKYLMHICVVIGKKVTQTLVHVRTRFRLVAHSVYGDRLSWAPLMNLNGASANNYKRASLDFIVHMFEFPSLPKVSCSKRANFCFWPLSLQSLWQNKSWFSAFEILPRSFTVPTHGFCCFL